MAKDECEVCDRPKDDPSPSCPRCNPIQWYEKLPGSLKNELVKAGLWPPPKAMCDVVKDEIDAAYREAKTDCAELLCDWPDFGWREEENVQQCAQAMRDLQREV